MRACTSALASIALSLAGCAQTGVLEVQIMLPPREAGDSEPLFARVQLARASDHPFDGVIWGGDDAPPFELDDRDPVRAQISAITEDASVDLHVRVRFCRSPACDSFDDLRPPEARYVLEHPFYVGRRTAWAACIGAVPTDAAPVPIQVGRCDIHGCAQGAAAPGYCELGDEGPHFCETGGDDVAPGELQCPGGVPQF